MDAFIGLALDGKLQLLGRQSLAHQPNFLILRNFCRSAISKCVSFTKRFMCQHTRRLLPSRNVEARSDRPIQLPRTSTRPSTLLPINEIRRLLERLDRVASFTLGSGRLRSTHFSCPPYVPSDRHDNAFSWSVSYCF